MGGPPFFCALFLCVGFCALAQEVGWGGLVFCGLLFFATKRFACWVQCCFGALREGVAGLCAVCCVLWRGCQWPYGCVGTGLC